MQYIIFIIFIFLFLPSCRFPLPGLQIYMFFLVLVPVMFFLTIIKPKLIFNNIVKLYKYTPFKYFIYFVTWVIFSSIILIFLGRLSILNFLYTLVMTFFCLFGLSYFLPTVMVKCGFNIGKIIKYYLIALLVLLVLGILFFVGYKYDIGIIQAFHSIICNERFLATAGSTHELGYFAKVRTASTFGEAGWFGEFLFFSIPIAFGLCTSKYRFFKNKYINKIIKKSVMPLIFLNLLLTKSPIWIFWGTLLSLYVYRHYFIKTYRYIFALVLIFTTFLIFMVIDDTNIIGNSKGNEILGRIENVFKFKNDFQAFAIVEGSLANRIISYKALWELFTKHPYLGVGYNNTAIYTYKIVISMGLPLTEEMIQNVRDYYFTGKMRINGSLLYTMLSGTGIIGTLLFYLFIFNIILSIGKLQKKCFGLEKIFFQQLKVAILVLTLVSFYSNQMCACYLYWFFFGLCNPFILQKRELMQRYIIKIRQNIINVKNTDSLE